MVAHSVLHFGRKDFFLVDSKRVSSACMGPVPTFWMRERRSGVYEVAASEGLFVTKVMKVSVQVEALKPFLLAYFLIVRHI